MDASELMRDAIDIHIHIGPDPNRRRLVNAHEAALQAKKAGMRGIVIKSHEYMTAPLAQSIQPFVPEVELYGGMSLDDEVGGLNPAAVEAAGKLNAKIIWMPTFSSKNDMQKRNIEGKGITIIDPNGAILPVVGDILELIKEYDMTLATGHLSTREIFVLLDEAKRIGVHRVVVTHPLSISVGPTASIDEQKQMIGENIYFEHCFISMMPTSDRNDPKNFAQAMRAVGPEHCIMSTDFGQVFNPLPIEGMRMFIETMLKFDFSEEEIISMVRTNPAKALGLPEQRQRTTVNN